VIVEFFVFVLIVSKLSIADTTPTNFRESPTISTKKDNDLTVKIPIGPKVIVVDQKHPKASDENPGTNEKPLLTINAGLEKANPGDTVLVRAGLYRENVVIKTSGTEDNRITLRAVKGERVIVSGGVELKNWQKCTKEEARGNRDFDKIYFASLDYRPAYIIQDGRPLKLSRWPKQAKTRIICTGGDDMRIIDDKNLTQPAGFWEGGTLGAHCVKSTNTDFVEIVSYDPVKKELVGDKKFRFTVTAGEDDYSVHNLVTLINEPGEWAIDLKKNKIYIRPYGDADPNKSIIEVNRKEAWGGGSISGGITWAPNTAYITIDGFEIINNTAFGVGFSGEGSNGGHHIEILNCVCYHNINPIGRSSAGIYISNCRDVLIKNCISFQNFNDGLNINTCKNIVCEENEIGYNIVDGVKVSWGSENIKFIRNFIHDQWAMFHPDGFQTFAGVENLVLDSNLIMNTGQIWQCEGTRKVKCFNNCFIGAHHNTLSISSRDTIDGQKFYPCSDFEWINNTIALVTSSGFTFGINDVAYNNLVYLGKDRNACAYYAWDKWKSDYNLFWAKDNVKVQFKSAPPNEKGKYYDLETIAKELKQEEHSKLADPKMKNVPVYYARLDLKKLKLNEPGKFYIYGNTKENFEPGDFIEVNFDGIVRTVREVTEEYFTFEPKVAGIDWFGGDVVCNWKKNNNFAIDTRLSDNSPGRRMGKDGKDVGSNIDIQAYKSGDLNMDGKRDLPIVPREAYYDAHALYE